MEFVAMAAAVVLVLLVGGTSTAMAWRAAPPRPRWCTAAACFWMAACGFGVSALSPSRMDAEGFLHEPGLRFVLVAYLATALGTLFAAWAYHGWRMSRPAFTPPTSAPR